MLSNIFYGLSQVYYNSYLPYLVQHHPRTVVENSSQTMKARKDETIASSFSTYGYMLGTSSCCPHLSRIRSVRICIADQYSRVLSASSFMSVE